MSIEEVTHQVAYKKLFPLFGRLTERIAAYIETSLTAINIWMDSVNEMFNQSPTPSGLPPLIVPQFSDISPEGIRESGEQVVRSSVPDLTTDSAAFVWASTLRVR